MTNLHIPNSDWVCPFGSICSILFTSAHKSGRVWGPGSIWWYSIWCTHCCHIPSWNKPCVTSEEYLGTTQCAWDSHNGTITRRKRHPTVDWKKCNCNAKLKRGSGRWWYDVALLEGRVLWLVLVVRAVYNGSLDLNNQPLKAKIVQVYFMWVANSQKIFECT